MRANLDLQSLCIQRLVHDTYKMIYYLIKNNMQNYIN